MIVDFINENYSWIGILLLLALNIIQSKKIDKLKKDNNLK
jgi:hypothetical protein